MNNDKLLIEDYLPIQAISKEASREKPIRKRHISTLHLWWAGDRWWRVGRQSMERWFQQGLVLQSSI